MTEPKTHRTRSGHVLTDKESDAVSAEVAETDDDLETLEIRSELETTRVGSERGRRRSGRQ